MPLLMGLSHADLGFAQGEWDDIGFGLKESRVLGHEGVGRIVRSSLVVS